MVDIGGKVATRRVAVAQSRVVLPKEIVDLLEGKDEIVTPKGPVLATAIIAGVMAAKRTSELIPFCHPLPLDKVDINIALTDRAKGELQIECQVACEHKTGVEMEALTGASVAALCVYDMCKAMSHNIVIQDTRLISKSGGKSDFRRQDT